MSMYLSSKDPFQRVEVRINDRFSLSIIQGFGTWSTDDTVEVAVLDWDAVEVVQVIREPRPEVTGQELADLIRDLQKEGN